jgi:hypothetical protein
MNYEDLAFKPELTWEELCDWVWEMKSKINALVGNDYVEILGIDFNKDHTIDADGVTIAKDRSYSQMQP